MPLAILSNTLSSPNPMSNPLESHPLTPSSSSRGLMKPWANMDTIKQQAIDTNALEAASFALLKSGDADAQRPKSATFDPTTIIIMAVLTTNFAAQQAIDRQIAQLQLTIRSLKQQRNTCSAFNQLPNDVLAMIFIAYKEEYSLTNISEHAQWVHILGALTIGFSDEYYDLECVQDFFAYASEHNLASLRSVKLDLHYHRIFQTVTINLETSLPWSQMSSLTYLELSEVLLPPDIPSLPSLSKLVISCRAADHGLSSDWITTFLRQTPNIEEIDLREIISSSDPFEDPDHTTIPFPLTRLRRIDVDAEGLDAIKLFDGLEIPTSTQVCGIYATCEKSDPIGAGVLSTLGSLISPSGNQSAPREVYHVWIGV
ncbi:hypothetical protein ONZ45_g1163 [Pleurotus djamor]|nr:hypothetical protein ONZ45_g1163 [Pleurotus djamor]